MIILCIKSLCVILLFHRSRNRQARIAVGDQGCLEGVVDVGFAGPDGCQKMVLAVKLMEPGAVYMIQDLFIQICHKLSVICCVFFFSGYTVQNCRRINGFSQGPVHSVVDDRVAVPVSSVNDSRCAVCVPAVCDRTVIKILRCLNIWSGTSLVLFVCRKSPLGNQSRPFNSVARSGSVWLELIVRTAAARNASTVCIFAFTPR